MAAGFAGIDKDIVIQHLNERGYSASKQRIEHFYKTNEGFFKCIMKKRNIIIPGWNDNIQSEDLTPAGIESSKKETESLTEIPDIKLEDEVIEK